MSSRLTQQVKQLRNLVAIFSISISGAFAADEPADLFIKRQSNEVFNALKTDPALQSADITKVMALVDSKIMPNVNFKRMTASAVGPTWRQASPEQQSKLQDEFKRLLVRTYAGALSQVGDLRVIVRPLRGNPEDNEVLVKTEVKGQGDPIQLDYRLEKTSGDGSGWKIYNLNIMGIWLVDTYRSQFAREINTSGLDGLIATMVAKNNANASKRGS